MRNVLRTLLVVSLGWILLSSFGLVKMAAVNKNGNRIEMSIRRDTMSIADPVSGEVESSVHVTIVVSTLNGEKVYQEEHQGMSYQYPLIIAERARVYNEIMDAIRPLCNELADGVYKIDIPVMLADKKGAVVYDSLEGLNIRDASLTPIDAAKKMTIDAKIAAVLSVEHLTPMVSSNDLVPYDIAINKVIKVTNHQIVLLN